jgi:hypothetical protein
LFVDRRKHQRRTQKSKPNQIEFDDDQQSSRFVVPFYERKFKRTFNVYDTRRKEKGGKRDEQAERAMKNEKSMQTEPNASEQRTATTMFIGQDEHDTFKKVETNRRKRRTRRANNLI